jgi:hypothetical protein
MLAVGAIAQHVNLLSDVSTTAEVDEEHTLIIRDISRKNDSVTIAATGNRV